MWLQDFLPHDIKNVRIMTYGYNTKLDGNTLDHRMLDYGRDMIQQLEVVRGSLEVLRQSCHRNNQAYIICCEILIFGRKEIARSSFSGIA